MRILLPAVVSLVLPALAGEAENKRLQEANEVLTEIMSVSDKAIPSHLFRKSHCAVVIPGLKKGGFVFSAKFGRGFASCRKPGGGWTAPAAMRVEGGGFGLQIGGQEADIVMLVMSQKGMKGMLASKFTLGGEASAAAGPVGRDSTAQTDLTMRADILSWSRSRGLFGGVSLQGGTLRPDEDANEGLYGRKMKNADILTGKVGAPGPAEPLLASLQKFGGAVQSQ